MGGEVFGLDLLGEIGDGLYADRDPTAVYHATPTYRVREAGDEGAYVIDIRLPFVEAEQVEARPFGDQLVVHVGNQRRNYVLPQFLTYYALDGTTLDDDGLHVRFSK